MVMMVEIALNKIAHIQAFSKLNRVFVKAFFVTSGNIKLSAFRD